jgi:hypothetical protein
MEQTPGKPPDRSPKDLTMGLDSRFLPDHIKTKMHTEDLPKGNAGKTTAQLAEKRELFLEREQHKIFWNYCLLKDITVDYHNPTKRTTNRAGWPDFPCFKKGRVLFVEFKSPTGRLSEAQKEVQAELERQGFKYVVVIHASDAIDIADTYLIQRKT